MPPKVKDLISQLEKAGYRDRGGKDSHRNFVHPEVTKPITISGQMGDAAKIYQMKAVARAVEEAIQIYRADNRPLPPATAGRDLAGFFAAA